MRPCKHGNVTDVGMLVKVFIPLQKIIKRALPSTTSNPRRSAFALPYGDTYERQKYTPDNTSISIVNDFLYRNLCFDKEFTEVEEIYMNNKLNRPITNPRITPYVHRTYWRSCIAILSVIIAAALAWNFWPYANAPYESPKDSRLPATQRATTQTPATSTAPAQQ